MMLTALGTIATRAKRYGRRLPRGEARASAQLDDELDTIIRGCHPYFSGMYHEYAMQRTTWFHSRTASATSTGSTSGFALCGGNGGDRRRGTQQKRRCVSFRLHPRRLGCSVAIHPQLGFPMGAQFHLGRVGEAALGIDAGSVWGRSGLVVGQTQGRCMWGRFGFEIGSARGRSGSDLRFEIWRSEVTVDWILSWVPCRRLWRPHWAQCSSRHTDAACTELATGGRFARPLRTDHQPLFWR